MLKNDRYSKRYSRIPIFLLVLIYMVLLHVSYRFFISPWFSYAHLVYVPPKDISIALSHILLTLLPAFIFPVQLERPSQLIAILLYMTVYIPLGMMPFYAPNLDFSLTFTFQVCACFFFLGCFLLWSSPVTPFNPIKIPQNISILLYVGFTSLLLVMLISRAGFVLKDIRKLGEDIYTTRLAFRQVSENFSGILAYALTWLSKVLIPLLLLLGQSNKNVILIGASLILQYYLFSLGNNKMILAIPLIVIIIYFIIKYIIHYSGVVIFSGMVLLLILSIFIDSRSNNSDVPPPIHTLIIRRSIMIPGILSGLYLDFFSANPPYRFSHSILSQFNQMPYNYNPANQIGYIYYDRSEMSANANFWADGYANFRFWGIISFNLILLFYFWLLDNLSSNKDLAIIFSLSVASGIALIDTALLTSFLTHGMLLSMVVVAFLPSKANLVGRIEEVNAIVAKEV